MLTSISGRSVIVTGASKGIGKGIARASFAGQGAKVLVVGPHAGGCGDRGGGDGQRRSAFSADVGRLGPVPGDGRAAAAERHGGIRHPLRETPGSTRRPISTRWTRPNGSLVLGTNLKGKLLLSVKACLAELKKSDQGPRHPDLLESPAR